MIISLIKRHCSGLVALAKRSPGSSCKLFTRTQALPGPNEKGKSAYQSLNPAMKNNLERFPVDAKNKILGSNYYQKQGECEKKKKKKDTVRNV